MTDKMIVRPITPDGMVGYDQFNQLVLGYAERSHMTYIFIRDLRRNICTICNRGWEATAASLKDQAHWAMLDDYVHASCLERYSGLQERTLFHGALCGTVRFEKMLPIKNGYWSESVKPWYEIELLDHPARFVLGRRKSVDVVELQPTKWPFSAEEIARAEIEFQAENVTKHFQAESVLLHAHTNEKVREYVERVATVMGVAIVREKT